MNSFYQRRTLCVLVAMLALCAISRISTAEEEPVSVSADQEKEECQWGDSGQQANEIISQWMKDNQWSNPNIFMLQNKAPFQGHNYCAAYTWDGDTEVWFYFTPPTERHTHESVDEWPSGRDSAKTSQGEVETEKLGAVSVGAWGSTLNGSSLELVGIEEKSKKDE